MTAQNMNAPNLNAWWCGIIAEVMLRSGIRDVVTCPGNRNVPLLFAIDNHPGLRVIPHVDERSGAFIALGLARATRRPVAICTTSGSAVANLLPACCEAYHANIPLVLITADRPHHLHGCGAPQTMHQQGLFSAFCLDALHAPEPVAVSADAGHMRDAVSRLLSRGMGPCPGPVHLNVPLDDPLPPLLDPAFREPALPNQLAHPHASQATAELHSTSSQLHEAILRPDLRGVIVAGPQSVLERNAAQYLTRTTGFPLIADAPSNLRHPDSNGLISTADALLAGPLGDSQAELIIRLGPAPIARPVYEWLQRQSCPVVRIDQHGMDRDFCHQQFHQLIRPSTSELKRLAEGLATGNADWLNQWIQADLSAQHARAEWIDQSPWNEIIAAATACTHPNFKIIQLANSLAIRHGNLHLGAKTERSVFANRGVNGIDGTLGTFIGTLLGNPKEPGLLLTGDLAFLHDLPALATAAQHTDINGTICLINNGGGGIFDLLPVSDHKRYRDLVRTPQTFDSAALAQGFGIPHEYCHSQAQLHDALTTFSQQNGIQIVTVETQTQTATELRQLISAMHSG